MFQWYLRDYGLKYSVAIRKYTGKVVVLSFKCYAKVQTVIQNFHHT